MAPRLTKVQLLALAQLAMLAHKHYLRLAPSERARLMTLVRRPHRMTREERSELRTLVAKMEPSKFAGGAARHISPLKRR